jgi:hypothetical protein
MPEIAIINGKLGVFSLKISLKFLFVCVYNWGISCSFATLILKWKKNDAL